MIEDAGFEVEGNPLYARESTAAGRREARGSSATDSAAEAFRIPGGGEELLKPEIVRS